MVAKKRVQAYVPHSTYRWLETVAEKEGISVSQVVSDMIQTVEAGGIFSQPAVDNEYVTKDEFGSVLSAFMRDVHLLIGSEMERKFSTLQEAISLAGLAHLGYDPTLPFEVDPTNIKRLEEIKKNLEHDENIPAKKTTPRNARNPKK